MTKPIGLHTKYMEFTQNITNEVVTKYINRFYQPLTPALGALRQEAEQAEVPIILKETEQYLKTMLAVVKPQRILEIGCAVGYSAMFFAACCGAEVVTIEKDPETYETACANLRRLGYEDCVTILCGDGEEAVNQLKQEEIAPFDLVFIDAAKSHYREFWDLAMPLCKQDAMVICDNVLMKGMTASDEYDPGKKYKTSIRKMREFIQYITDLPYADTCILPVGDGVSISVIDKGKNS